MKTWCKHIFRFWYSRKDFFWWMPSCNDNNGNNNIPDNWKFCPICMKKRPKK